jgi:hypothetical protein
MEHYFFGRRYVEMLLRRPNDFTEGELLPECGVEERCEEVWIHFFGWTHDTKSLQLESGNSGGITAAVPG